MVRRDAVTSRTWSADCVFLCLVVITDDDRMAGPVDVADDFFTDALKAHPESVPVADTASGYPTTSDRNDLTHVFALLAVDTFA